MSRRRELNLALAVHSALVAAFLLSIVTFLVISWLRPGVGGSLAAAGGVVLVVAGVTVGVVVLRLREGPKDAEVTSTYLPVLKAELSQLAAEVADQPMPDPNQSPELAACREELTAHLRAAERSLFTEDQPARTADEVSDLTGHIADARYLLVVFDALRHGLQRPLRGAPCFFDPSHGPFTTKVRFNPDGGSDRTTTACPRCHAALGAGETPQSKQIAVNGTATDYWRAGWVSVPYVDGYWQERRFPDHALHRLRRELKVTWDTSALDLPEHLKNDRQHFG